MLRLASKLHRLHMHNIHNLINKIVKENINIRARGKIANQNILNRVLDGANILI